MLSKRTSLCSRAIKHFTLAVPHKKVLFINCGRQEEPAIVISRLLLRMRRMYVASSCLFGLPLRMNGMRRTQFDHARLHLQLTRNLITLVLTICHVKRLQSTALPHSVTFGYY